MNGFFWYIFNGAARIQDSKSAAATLVAILAGTWSTNSYLVFDPELAVW